MNSDSEHENAPHDVAAGKGDRRNSTIPRDAKQNRTYCESAHVRRHGVPNGLRYQIAATMTDREAAFRLVYRVYRQCGLQQVNADQIRVLPQHLLSTTQVFVGKAGDEVVSTVTLVVDDARHGVPMEAVYQRPIAQRRALKIRFGEVCCFADRSRRFRNFLRQPCELTRLMAQYARSQGVEQLLVAVHPRHARFYTRMMGFEPIGPVTSYPGARHQPAIALCLDFERIDQHPPPCYRRYFAEKIPVDELVPQAMTAVERSYFARMIDVAAIADGHFDVRQGEPAKWRPDLWRLPPDAAAG